MSKDRAAGLGEVDTKVSASSFIPIKDTTIAVLLATFDKLSPEIVRRVVERWAQSSTDPDLSVGGYFVPPTSAIYRLSEGPVQHGPTIVDPIVEVLPADSPIDLGVFNSLVGGRAYLVKLPVLKGLTMSIRDASTNVVTQSAIPKSCLLALADYQATAQIMALLSRYTLLLTKAEIPTEDAEYVFDFCQLKTADPFVLSEIETFLTYDRLRKKCTSALELSVLLRQTSFDTVEDLASALSSLTGWLESISKSLLTGLREDKGTLADAPVNISLEILQQLDAAYDITWKTGLSDASDLFAWARAHHSSTAAAVGLRDALRAQVDDEAWEARAKALFDPLRAASRNALVAACVNQRPQLGDADGLFEHFLIDVSMGTCLKTSRLNKPSPASRSLSSVAFWVLRMV